MKVSATGGVRDAVSALEDEATQYFDQVREHVLREGGRDCEGARERQEVTTAQAMTATPIPRHRCTPWPQVRKQKAAARRRKHKKEQKLIRLREKNAESAERMRMMKLFRQEKDLELMNLKYRLKYDSVREIDHCAQGESSVRCGVERSFDTNSNSLLFQYPRPSAGTRVAGPFSNGGYSEDAEPGGAGGRRTKHRIFEET